MKKMRKFGLLAGALLLAVLLLIGFAVPASAQVYFSVVYGEVTIDGGPPLVDTVIDAYVGAEVTPRATRTVTTTGVYSILIVGSAADVGAALSFKSDTMEATATPAGPVFQLASQEVDLAFVTGPPPPRYDLTVTINPPGGGVVNLDPVQPVDGYVENTVVQLTAVHAVDYSFANWSGHLTGSANPATILMASDKNVTANFTPPPPPGEFHKWLGAGWNYMSTPAKLASNLGDIVQGDFVAYRFYAPNQMWYAVGSTYVLNPLEAIAIYVDTATELVFVVSDDINAPPIRQLYAKWNLVGPAPAYDPGIEDFPSIPVNQALISITTSYTNVVSPALNQAGWTYIIGAATVPLMDSYRGYFVFLLEVRIVAGESTTPLEP